MGGRGDPLRWIAGKHDTIELALESLEQHRVVRQLMPELEQLQAEEETWMPRIKVLRESVEQHLQEEVDEVIPKEKAEFTEDQMEEWSGEFVQINKRIQKMSVP